MAIPGGRLLPAMSWLAVFGGTGRMFFLFCLVSVPNIFSRRGQYSFVCCVMEMGRILKPHNSHGTRPSIGPAWPMYALAYCGAACLLLSLLRVTLA